MSIARIPNLVSVVIPVYNRAAYIKACLNSLLRQTYRNLEIIVVNDGSTDKTMHVVGSWKHALKMPPAKKERIVLVNLPRNIDVAGAIHTGMFMAQGEFIAMQDSDDLSHPSRIQKQVTYLRRHASVAMVGSNYAYFPHGAFHRRKPANWIRYGSQINRTYSEGGHCVCHGTILFRGSVFDQIGGHNRKVEGAEDYEFIARAIKNQMRVENIPEVLYYYRNHHTQRSRKFY
ncbi:glycosyltransferase family 2 protein [Caldalkalibacillus salinus]|uniref:glycosyltransferase family 2 protein n=1 Tax=Caldalkalibacillus salinus TaxID=2803787 RepID=UPI001921F764|nr:glycosyltransferase family 2 protein [Caldalkalibacillus salinus]